MRTPDQDDLLPEENTEDTATAEDSPIPTEDDPDTPRHEGAEDDIEPSAERHAGETPSEKSTQSREKVRRPHASWRGWWLACAMAASVILLGFANSLDIFRGERRMLAYAGAVAVGAFIGGLPGLLRGKVHPARPTWGRALRGFLCGAGMALALGAAGGGWLVPAALTGSLGAWGFGLAALVGGFITVRTADRRRA